MPAIRDFQWAFETVTTDAGITIPKPTTSTNDLLLIFAMGDTGAPTWTAPTGFTQLFARNNTVSTVCYYRIADGTEASTFTVGSSVTETYNGICISIQDINTTNPFGNPAVFNDTTQAAAAKYSFQQITTSVANSLVIYLAANSVAGVPSVLEGPVFGLLGADGAAESMGVGWGFKASTGLTPSNVTCSNVSTGAGVKAVIQIAPPSGGATVIPAYCSEDTSSYLDPINGTTAFNSNTALAATADTNFGTSLGGFTAADATVAAAADTGINSFHSTGQLTAPTSATQIAGAELVFAVANRPDVTGKNILCHVQASTPLQLQRTGSVGSNKGIWFGIRSAAANYKIWQVLGADSPGAAGRPIPVIINESAANTIASGGTLVATAVQALGVWCNGSAVGTSVWQFASAWLMGKTVVCGGNASAPIDIGGLVGAVATGKERVSAIRQGTNQMLLLQEVQIGNGGTDATYLDLNATAIELPSQRNTTRKLVSYNSTDNAIGIEYYAGSSDTIKHRNSVISSPSRYYWRLNASSSTSATYDFSGLSVIGAGAITLNRAITISGLTINDYTSISANDLDFVDCTITVVPASNDSVTSNSGTSFSTCAINVSTVTSGNRWISVASPSIFSNCTFTGGGGHAIRITTAGTYSFDGNVFSGFGADGSNGAAIFNDSGGAVTINITGGGSTPTVRNGTSASTTINNSVTLTITVQDVDTNDPVENARVYVTASSGGPLPEGTVLIDKLLTNASGQVSDTRSYASNQPITGRVRKSSASPYYKESPVVGTVSSTAGLSLTVLLISDE